ncbi:unnamed protein product, partial [marine sediment metagenome]
MNKPEISIVLGSYNRKWLLKLAIQSVRDNAITVPYEIIVVDGGSTDGALEWLIKQRDVITVVQHNRGMWKGAQIQRRSWGYFINLAFKCAQGKFVCMISDDCILHPNAVINGYRLFEAELAKGRKIGAVAFYWRNFPKQEKYLVGLTLGNKMFVNHGMYLRETLEKVGWIDEDHYRFYYADGDLCLKMWLSNPEGSTMVSQVVQHLEAKPKEPEFWAIPFNKPCVVGAEFRYISEAIERGHASGDGYFTKQCHALLERELGVPKVLLTTSCTHALEMAALLLNIQSGDEVIVPSFTFVSTANAFVLRGARPVFIDIRADTLNLD